MLLVFCHPVEASYQATLNHTTRAPLERAGRQVDDCGLYAQGFCPLLSRAERINHSRRSIWRRCSRVQALDPAALRG